MQNFRLFHRALLKLDFYYIKLQYLCSKILTFKGLGGIVWNFAFELDILQISQNIKANDYKIDKDGKLIVKWSEGNHISYYDQIWLRNNCYTLNNKKERY